MSRPGLPLLPAGTSLVALLLATSSAAGRECRSSLLSHLWELGDHLGVGAEYRLQYLGTELGEGFLRSGTDQAERWGGEAFFGGMKILAALYPTADLSLILEVQGPGPWLSQAFAELARGDLTLTGGVQSIRFGSGALLDQRFAALDVRLRLGRASVEAFAGTTSSDLMRSCRSCLLAETLAHTQGWKVVGPGHMESMAAGVLACLGGGAGATGRLGGMLLLSWPDLEELRSLAAALMLRAPRLLGRLWIELEPMVLANARQELLPAGLMLLRSRPVEELDLTLGMALALRRGGGPPWPPGTFEGDGWADPTEVAAAVRAHRFAPVYENLSWGMIQRFGLFQGRLLMGRASYQGLGRIFDPFVTYVVRFQEPSLASANTGDELDAGIELNLKDLYKLQVAYVAANLAGPHRASHMCFVELRVVLGSQLP
jgi:hypothetical protein